jgi:ceramide glucosyltransferase
MLVLLDSSCVENFFYYLALVQIAVGIYLVWDALRWTGYARRRLRASRGFYMPRAAVLCPCKGLEAGLERNLAALAEFDYKDYEVFFILATTSDPAHGVVTRMASESKVPAHVIIANRPDGCGEKVHNLTVAIQQLPEDFEVLVFADSDGRPGKSWLGRMVSPLHDVNVGAATTMRWFIPNRGNLATALLAAWNASIVTMLKEKGQNFCWGGGTAIRRLVFQQAGVVEEWSHSVSDDYSMTRALERARRAIIFVPECLTASYMDTDFRGLFEFTNRQVLITRVYSGKTWAWALATHLLYCLTLLLGAWVTVDNLLATLPAFHLAFLTFVPILLAAIRGGLRALVATEAIPVAKAQITNNSWIYIALGAFIPFLMLANFAASLLTRKMKWRGVTYELISPQQTRILA